MKIIEIFDGVVTLRTVEKNRGRTEHRAAYITQNIDWLYGKEKWSNLKSIGAICSTVTHKGKNVTTWHFYISSRAMSAQKLLRRARLEIFNAI